MKMQKQHGQPACMIYALAMAIDEDAQEIIACLKQAGYVINHAWSPHIQDLINIAFAADYAITEIEPNPVIGNPVTGEMRNIYTEEQAQHRLDQFMRTTSGMLHVQLKDGQYHMVAWDGHKVYDPRGYCTSPSQYNIVAYYITSKIK
jgi:hypothetical protein